MLHDRLTNDTDRRYFYKLLSEQLHNGFKTRWTPAELEKTPLIFGDFLEGGSHHSARVYRFVRRYDRLPQILEVSSFVLFVLFSNLESNLIFLLLFILYLILVCLVIIKFGCEWNFDFSLEKWLWKEILRRNLIGNRAVAVFNGQKPCIILNILLPMLHLKIHM